MRSFCLTATVIILLLTGTGFAQNSSVHTTEEIVEQFFPQSLVDDSEKRVKRGGPSPFKTSTFRVADLDGIGTENYIVAAYTNGFSAAIRVLKLDNGNAMLVTEPNLRLLGGIYPALELVDIENDGRPEVVAFFSSNRGITTDWVFKWTGTELSLIGPASIDKHGDVFTVLVQSDFIDVEGDGVLEIITPPTHRPFPPALRDTIKIDTYKIYSFDGQTYQLTKTLNYFGIFSRRTETPVVSTRGFDVQDLGDDFVLTIINGMPDGKDRVSSAVIRLNGVVIVGPNDLNQEVGQIVREVSVLQDNVVEVELHGEAGGQVMITVEPPKD